MRWGGGIADLSYPNSKTRRGRVQDDGLTCPTITAESNGLHRLESTDRIRKLTPLECWRLMGFDDEDFYKAEAVCSNTQLYKQAGNSIVVNVLESILRNLPIQQKDGGENLRLIVYDCEVFCEDWLVIFKDIETGQYTVIHNDTEEMKQCISEDCIYVGFNSKHYDQFIIKAICCGFTPQEVKQVNDFIIGGGQGWECPMLRDQYFRFNNVDIKDDMQMGLSLKAIEGHLGMSVEETSVSFDIDRPLTEEELKETVFYCKHDVDTTEKLVELRRDYLKSKINIGRLAGIDEVKAMGMTNAKLTAALLQGSKKPHDDERQYQYPPNLKRELIPPEVFEFFDRMKDPELSDKEIFSSKIEIKIGDCPVTIGYGGIHGAIPNYLWKEGDSCESENE